MGRTKKICLFVVEGIADESSLALPLQNIFDTYYKQKGIEFQVTHGDITSKDSITEQNIVSKIGRIVNDFLKRNHLQKKIFVKLCRLLTWTEFLLKIIVWYWMK